MARMAKDEQPAIYEDGNLYKIMLQASLVGAGNNARLKKFLHKARGGEKVRIGAIGGSITEGAGADSFLYGYVFQFAKAVAEIWCFGDHTRFHLVTAGLGGTPSALGIMRYRRDVTDGFGDAAPDLLLIEFAVNDTGECTGGRAYEALVLDALSASPDTAVLLVFSVFPGLKNLQERYVPVGRHYGLPMVSVRDAIAVPYADGRMADQDFFADIYHPVTAGHTLMSDCLLHLLRTVDEATADQPYPVPADPVYGAEFCGTRLMTANGSDPVRSGSFCCKDEEIQRFVTLGRFCFPDNWHHAGDIEQGESFQAELMCRTILLDYKLSKSERFGSAEMYVDGRKV